MQRLFIMVLKVKDKKYRNKIDPIIFRERAFSEANQENAKRCVDALLLSFQEEIHLGHYIPDSHKISKLAITALEEICDSECKGQEEIFPFCYLHPENISERILVGLYGAIETHRKGDLSIIEELVSGSTRQLIYEWFPGLEHCIVSEETKEKPRKKEFKNTSHK
jgi:hypothetical protein